MTCSQLGPNTEAFTLTKTQLLHGPSRLWDEVNNNQMNHEEETAARLDEFKQLHSHDINEKVLKEECWQSIGNRLAQVTWLVINKGDNVNHEHRSWQVAKAIKSDKRLDMLAATPSLKDEKLISSVAIPEALGHKEGKRQSGLKIDFSDISAATFQADAINEVDVQLPAEDSAPDMGGRLKTSTYGTQGAAQNWGQAYIKFMRSTRFETEQASPCLFWHLGQQVRHMMRGDDCTILGWKQELDWLAKETSTRSESKHRGRSGLARSDPKEIRIFNRVTIWTDAGILHKAVQRHVQICVSEVRIEESSRTISGPIDSPSQKTQRIGKES